MRGAFHGGEWHVANRKLVLTIPWNPSEVLENARRLRHQDRRAYLDQVCPTAESRDEILALLAHDDSRPFRWVAEQAPRPEPVKQGDEIDGYRIVRRLGEGGMGVVYLAEKAPLGTTFALKFLKPHLTESEAALGRFMDEAKNAAALNHPAIVKVFDLRRNGPLTFIVSEFVEGVTLRELIKEERGRCESTVRAAHLAAWHRRAATIVSSVADALECAHRAELVHCDVKPSNILIDPVRGPRLTDFGIARHLASDAHTAPASSLFTAAYTSPEQARLGEVKIDQRSDIFSLGIVLYELLALRRPFDGNTDEEVLRSIVADQPTRLRSCKRRVPADLEAICNKALAKLPQARYSRAELMAAELRCFLSGKPMLTRPMDLRQRVVYFARRRARALITISLLMLMLALVAATRAIFVLRDRDLCWLQVTTDGVPATAFLQATSPEGALVGTPTRLGATPIADRSLAGGQYRVTVVREDGAFAEFNVLLLRTGRAAGRQLIVREGFREQRSENEGHREEGDDPSSLYAVFRKGEDVAARDGMIPVDAGLYSAEHPAEHDLFRAPTPVSRFWIDAHKVSNAEYQEFLDQTGHPRPGHWSSFDYPTLEPDYPVVNITLADAEAFARWKGKRLPTQLEWQAAARGPHGDLYPWGSEAPPEEAPLTPQERREAKSQGSATFKFYREHAYSVLNERGRKSLPGRPLETWENGREFCADVDVRAKEGSAAGRAWSDAPGDATLALIRRGPLFAPIPENGFRCAKSGAPPDLSHK